MGRNNTFGKKAYLVRISCRNCERDIKKTRKSNNKTTIRGNLTLLVKFMILIEKSGSFQSVCYNHYIWRNLLYYWK